MIGPQPALLLPAALALGGWDLDAARARAVATELLPSIQGKQCRSTSSLSSRKERSQL